MRSTTLANVAFLLATASGARQKYKGAPPEALHTAILHGGGVEGVDHELKRTLALAAAGGSSDGVTSSSATAEAATICGLSKQRLCRHEAVPDDFA